jgi:hypothetical protein
MQFNGIISDLFPGVSLPEPDYKAMTVALKDVCAELNLQPTNYFLLKVACISHAKPKCLSFPLQP